MSRCLTKKEFIEKVIETIESNQGVEKIDCTQPFQIGALNFIACLSIGGISSYPIVIPPYDSGEIFNESFLDGINMLGVWSFSTAGLWLPCAPCYAFAISAIPIPGLEQYMQKFWIGESLFGMFIGALVMGVVCYRDNSTPDFTIFEVCLSITGAEFLVGLG